MLDEYLQNQISWPHGGSFTCGRFKWHRAGSAAHHRRPWEEHRDLWWRSFAPIRIPIFMSMDICIQYTPILYIYIYIFITYNSVYIYMYYLKYICVYIYIWCRWCILSYNICNISRNVQYIDNTYIIHDLYIYIHTYREREIRRRYAWNP